MFSTQPDISKYLDASWDAYKPFYQDLSMRNLEEGSVHQWLLDWTWVHDLFCEVRERLYVAYNQDTANEAAQTRYFNFIEGVFPQVMSAEQQLKIMLLESELEPAGFQISLRNIRAEAGLFREDNLPLKSEEKKLISEYEKITGIQSITWDGQDSTIPQLYPDYQKSSRDVRQQMWELVIQRRLADRSAINDLWQNFMSIRSRIYSNAGLPDYRVYMWQELNRFDYTPDDCYTFHHAIEKVVVPVATQIYEKRRNRMGLKELRPWDLDLDLGVYSFYVPPLKPYQVAEDLEKVSSRIIHRVDPKLGKYFEVMREEGLLDLHNRQGKAPGGYCTTFCVSKRPFIFLNAVGIHDDVQSLLHEAGHAFHVFETNDLPYYQQRWVGIEFDEVASTAMELLSTPYLPSIEGGFYSDKDSARALIEQLERYILFWPYLAVVDAFQHWVYTHHSVASDPDNCDRKWEELWNRFIPGVDWTGLDDARRTGWHRKIHIHTDPFYYVEYGFAQLGALQVWRNALQDQARAVRDYRAALALGGTVTIPELYQAAGGSFSFDMITVKGIVSLIERTITELEEVITG